MFDWCVDHPTMVLLLGSTFVLIVLPAILYAIPPVLDRFLNELSEKSE